MPLARIRILTQDTDPLELLPENPARGTERGKQTPEKIYTIKAQWHQCVEAAKNEHTRLHFDGMTPIIEARLNRNDTERKALFNRQKGRETLASHSGKEEPRGDIRTNTEIDATAQDEKGKRQHTEGTATGPSNTSAQEMQADTVMDTEGEQVVAHVRALIENLPSCRQMW